MKAWPEQRFAITPSRYNRGMEALWIVLVAVLVILLNRFTGGG